MDRSNLRPFPARPTPLAGRTAASGRPDAEAAERELEQLFGRLLARGASDEESPDYDLLEAAVDGRLDPVESEIFASRLAGDAGLQCELDELVALRDRLGSAGTAPSSRRAVPGSGRRWIGLAAAAVLLAVVGVGLRQHSDAMTDSVANALAGVSGEQIAAQTPHSGQPLFADSFEGGTTDRWSN